MRRRHRNPSRAPVLGARLGEGATIGAGIGWATGRRRDRAGAGFRGGGAGQGRPCSVGRRGSRPGPPNGRAPVMYACSVCVLVCVRRTVVCIYEGSNCDMLSAQRKANNLRPTHLPFFLAKPPRGTPACSIVLHIKKKRLFASSAPPQLFV